MANTVQIMGLGGSLRAASTSRTALEVALQATTAAAMIWSSPTYHGSVSGSFKNALDWLILLAERDSPYLTNKPVDLVTTAGGIQGACPDLPRRVGAEGEIEIRQLTELERSDASG